VEEWFRKAKLLNKKREVVILEGEAMGTRVVEEEELVIDKTREKVIDCVFFVIEEEKQIAVSEIWLF